MAEYIKLDFAIIDSIHSWSSRLTWKSSANKVVVVTGAGKGIGYFLANELSKRSSTVYAIDKMFSKQKQKNIWIQK